MSSPADNPFASPQTADEAVPREDGTTFLGICRRGFLLSRRFKFFIRQGELLAGRVGGPFVDRIGTWSLRFLVATLLVIVGVALAVVIANTAPGLLRTFAMGYLALSLLTIIWIDFIMIPRRRNQPQTTRYDTAPTTLDGFQQIHADSFRLTPGDTVSVKAYRRRSKPLNGWRWQGELHFHLHPSAGMPKRLTIVVPASTMMEFIVEDLRAAGFPLVNG